MGLALVGAVATALFIAAFITKRRFGVLVLALTAGLVLSQQLTTFMNDLMAVVGLNINGLQSEDLAKGLLILIPVAVILISGPRYSSKLMALISAIGFSLFATLLFISPLMNSLQLPEALHKSIESLLGTLDIIVPSIIALALLDVVGTRFAHPRKKSKH